MHFTSVNVNWIETWWSRKSRKSVSSYRKKIPNRMVVTPFWVDKFAMLLTLLDRAFHTQVENFKPK
jgi:hypothetical protein